LLIVERDGGEACVGDGAVHARLPVFGCYLHGLFENRALREGFLNHLRRLRGLPSLAAERDWEDWREDRLDRLARITRSSLNMPLIYSLLGP
jgi:adenosylcobyric acid synthase